MLLYASITLPGHKLNLTALLTLAQFRKREDKEGALAAFRALRVLNGMTNQELTCLHWTCVRSSGWTGKDQGDHAMVLYATL